eukprot:7391913-Prymnesium_polylepis.3
MAHKLVSSKRPTRYASLASCSATIAEAWKRSLRTSSSVDFWNRRISRNATVPGRYRCGFLTRRDEGADMRAAFVASCLRGAFPPVDRRAVCLILPPPRAGAGTSANAKG